MNLSTYACNTEELYFLDLLSFSEIMLGFDRHNPRLMPDGSDVFMIHVGYWSLNIMLKRGSDLVFNMGIVVSLAAEGFEIPFHNWGYSIGVKL